MTKTYYTMDERRERLVKGDLHDTERNLTNTIVLVYGDAKTTFIFDVDGLNDEEIAVFIKSFISDMTRGCNFKREIIAQANNVYFIY